MHPRESDPSSHPAAAIDTAVDRRRQGRPQSVNPLLVPLLRGQLDPAAPADPILPRPGGRTLDRELLSGAAITIALILAGTVLRFAV